MQSAERWNEMRSTVKQCLVIGALVGFFLGLFFYHESNNVLCFILIPVAAVMAAATQFIPAPSDEEEE